MSKNYLSTSVLLAFFILIFFISLSFLPSQIYEAIGLKKTSVISDLVKAPLKKVSTYRKPRKAFTPPKDSVIKKFPEPIDDAVYIENYRNDSLACAQIANSLRAYAADERPLRIAYFGDSFIEGDMMTADIRDTLQAVYGRSGIGFLPITSVVAGYRNTVRHTFSDDWATQSIIDIPMPRTVFGITGYTFTPADGSWVQYAGVNRPGLASFDLIKIFYSGASGEKVMINKEDYVLEPGKKIQMLEVDLLNVRAVKLVFEQLATLKVYGVSIEKKSKGIILDNFSLRGNSGIGLGAVPQRMYKDMDSLLHYDLIFLQYGLNVANEKYTDYDWYKRGMYNSLQTIKRSFKHCPIVLVSVSDRGTKEGTMTGIKELLEVQQEMAEEQNLLFFNLFDAMGGEGSMNYFVQQKMANTDYTHLSFRGGHIVGMHAARAIVELLETIKKSDIYKHAL